jgi:ribonuclease P protein component
VLATVSESMPGRLGLAVSKKALRRAVDRNRMKRQIREAFRQRRARLAGQDIVVMVRREVATAERATVRAALNRLLDRVAGAPAPKKG